MREIVRCRETVQREILRSRHYVLKLLLRRGLIYHAGVHWTLRHGAWLEEIRRSGVLTGGDAVAYDEYRALLAYKLGRRAELDRQIEALALTPTYQPVVSRLMCFRGVSTLGAMVLATELGDWQRFAKPTQLMAYLGLVPTEHSSGTRERRGAITKAGNSRCRHIPRASGLARAPPCAHECRPHAAATGPVAAPGRARVESPAALAHALSPPRGAAPRADRRGRGRT